jgi:hypothetical protein
MFTKISTVAHSTDHIDMTYGNSLSRNDKLIQFTRPLRLPKGVSSGPQFHETQDIHQDRLPVKPIHPTGCDIMNSLEGPAPLADRRQVKHPKALPLADIFLWRQQTKQPSASSEQAPGRRDASLTGLATFSDASVAR